MNTIAAGLIAFLVLLVALSAAGCIAEESPAPAAGVVTVVIPPVTVTYPVTVTPVPTTPGCAYPPLNPWTWVPESYTPTATTKIPPAPGTLVSKADLFGTPSLRWDEYESSQQSRGLHDSYGTSRMEKSREDFQGTSVIHENHTYFTRMPGPGWELAQTTMDDMYYDDYGNMLSMHRRVIRDGKFLENADRPPVNTGRGTPDCSGEVFTPRYTFIGTDPITVPAGTYPGTMKYIVYNEDDQSDKYAAATYWFAPGVPVAVKWMIEDPEEGRSSTYELKGWE
jgi:hypothetical protein